MTDEMKKNEVTEEQLEGVAGGGRWSTYSSGDTPKFKEGQCVIFFNTRIGNVKKVSKEKSGTFCKEFTYTVEVFGEIESGMPAGCWRKLDQIAEFYDVWESDLKPASVIHGPSL